MDDATKALLILAVVIIVFIWNRISVGVVAIGTALALWATGLVTTAEALAGFGDPVVVFIATLFVVSEALESTGVTAWAGQQLMARAGTGRVAVLVSLSVLAAILTSFITLNGAVAAMIPLVVATSQRMRTRPGQLLMPIVFAGSAGGLLTLISSPVNVIVSEAAEENGAGPFAFFSFGLLGVPLLAGTIAISILWGRRLLPSRAPASAPVDLTAYPEVLADEYGVAPSDLLDDHIGVAEVVVPPRSDLVGERVHPGMVRDHGLKIMSVQRRGKQLTADPDRDSSIHLAEGDAILVQGDWDELALLVRDRDVLVVDCPELLRRQVVAWGPLATRACLILAAMVVLLATRLVPPAIAGLAAASAMVLTGIVTTTRVYRAISWQTVVLVGGLIPLSTAIQKSGAADRIANVIIDAVGSSRPYLLMLAVFALTAILGQVISNTATVLVVAPIAVSAAHSTGTGLQPLLMTVAVAGAAALLTPIATPGNMMIMNPAGYRFGDYWKFGLPVMVWWLVVAMTIIPLVWPL